MTKLGPRPHTWTYQDPIKHVQHTAWMRQRAQAHYRREEWELTLEQWILIWGELWHNRGRASTDYCLTRKDPELPWDTENTVCMVRREHLQRKNRRLR
jgi:hypothetical protein